MLDVCVNANGTFISLKLIFTHLFSPHFNCLSNLFLNVIEILPLKYYVTQNILTYY